MEHLYVATYYIVSAENPEPIFFTTEDVCAQDEESAIEKAWIKGTVLEVLEKNKNNRVGTNSKITVILAGIRDQLTKRTVFLL